MAEQQNGTQINVSTSAMKQAWGEYTAGLGEFQRQFNRANDTQAQLMSAWTGDAAKYFDASYRRWADGYGSIIRDLERIANIMQENIGHYIKVEHMQVDQSRRLSQGLPNL
ncbi:WXG100 family type VII secretion target [Saccharothrix australiensis]|uniref:WXG100 family type VII secretion target n=1 Tax=Saccharothrix australiensis TaxID=2072 RepID=A0A495W6N6_9PSEU|nr:WXG100 family type VII secretion target [Saccharothrix australiensis]RKT56747.1 WXG100 family type VII secretion target [Saccharothrix australiensis]